MFPEMLEQVPASFEEVQKKTLLISLPKQAWCPFLVSGRKRAREPGRREEVEQPVSGEADTGPTEGGLRAQGETVTVALPLMPAASKIDPDMV